MCHPVGPVGMAHPVRQPSRPSRSAVRPAPPQCVGDGQRGDQAKGVWPAGHGGLSSGHRVWLTVAICLGPPPRPVSRSPGLPTVCRGCGARSGDAVSGHTARRRCRPSRRSSGGIQLVLPPFVTSGFLRLETCTISHHVVCIDMLSARLRPRPLFRSAVSNWGV